MMAKKPCFIARQSDGSWKCIVCNAVATTGPLDSMVACPNWTTPKKGTHA